MIEQNKRICKKCNNECDRIMAGKYPNGKDKKWVDGSGKEWSGKTCPTCHKGANKENQAKKRTQKIISSSTVDMGK